MRRPFVSLGVLQLILGMLLWTQPETYTQGWWAFGSGCVFLAVARLDRRRGGGRR